MTTINSTPAASATAPQPASLGGFVRGSVIRPGQPGFAEATTPWNLGSVSRPALVLVAADAADVVAAVRWARANDYRVAVQATGHGAGADQSGTLLISTRDLDRVEVRADGVVRAEAGVTWQRVLDECAPHGRAALAGSSTNVGVVGYLTGGGIGPIARSRGLASDRVLAVDVVTGDGELRRVTAEAEPDLFWGLRGGKGSLGIVTAVEFETLPIADLYGGYLHFAPSDAREVAEKWVRWSATLPADATTSIVFAQLPPLPGIPEALVGPWSVMVRFAYLGDGDDGSRLLAPMRDVADPVIDAVGYLPYSALGGIHNDPADPQPSVERGVLLRAFTEDTVDAVLDALRAAEGLPLMGAEVRQVGGAIRTGAPSAVDHRDAEFALFVIGLDLPEVGAVVAARADAVIDAVDRWSLGAAWPNFAPGDPSARRLPVYTPETAARLASISRRYDPSGVIAAADALRAERS